MHHISQGHTSHNILCKNELSVESNSNVVMGSCYYNNLCVYATAVPLAGQRAGGRGGSRPPRVSGQRPENLSEIHRSHLWNRYENLIGSIVSSQFRVIHNASISIRSIPLIIAWGFSRNDDSTHDLDLLFSRPCRDACS